MRIAIMQPYILPYIGYFQLINAVDKFVVYDNIQFTKKGWINRNRILVNGKDEYITLPLKSASDYLTVAEKTLADSYTTEKIKLLRKITGAYLKATEYKNIFPVIETVVNYSEMNLFKYIFNSLKVICSYLDIKTEFIVSSTLDVNHNLKSQDKVLAICKALNASQYINPIGGMELYAPADFMQHNIKLNFLQATPVEYKQFQNIFVPWLSIIDVLMFNPKEKVKEYLQHNFILK
jgi:hypothetical protein